MDNSIIDVLEVAIISFFLIFLLSTITLIIFFLYKKRQIENKNKIQLLNLKFEADVLKSNLEIQEETLYNVSREIHDNISLNLTLSKLYLNTISSELDEKSHQLITSSIDLISKSLYDLNNLSKSLDGEMIKRNGLLFSIENEVENIKKIGSIDVKFNIVGECFYIKPEVELLVFRIIQESLKNSIIHSCSKIITLEIEYRLNSLCITISDNGKGFEPSKIYKNKEKKMSTGLSSMKKRADLINAEFFIDSEYGKGTTTILNIPIKEDDKR